MKQQNVWVKIIGRDEIPRQITLEIESDHRVLVRDILEAISDDNLMIANRLPTDSVDLEVIGGTKEHPLLALQNDHNSNNSCGGKENGKRLELSGPCWCCVKVIFW